MRQRTHNLTDPHRRKIPSVAVSHRPANTHERLYAGIQLSQQKFTLLAFFLLASWARISDSGTTVTVMADCDPSVAGAARVSSVRITSRNTSAYRYMCVCEHCPCQSARTEICACEAIARVGLDKPPRLDSLEST